jgi:sulfite oxidase
MKIARRTIFHRLLQGLGAGLVLNQPLAGAQTQEEESGRSHTGPLIVHVARPFNAETPVREFTSLLTPNHRFFVRSHFGPPPQEAVAEDTWTLQVGGLVERAQTFRLKDLQKIAPVTITAVVQCSGNGRAHFYPKVPGVQWDRGAVGNAQWTGVRLKDVLQRCGVQAEAKHVQFRGADRPVVASVPLFVRSIPVNKALHPDTILAYEMNGRPLPLVHGAPLRVMTPGWMADSCIKWLTDIVVRADEAQGYYMQTAYRVPSRPLAPGTSGDESLAMLPVEEMPVKSLIAAPTEGETLGQGPVMIRGVAWAGEAPVTKVEVSCDDGITWDPARLLGETVPYGWRQWQYRWNPRAAGAAHILCRATDARGERQPATSTWNPSGFLWNGWDRITVVVEPS